MRLPMTWAYGVTTVPARARELLPRTLKSLEAAGFPEPWLFVDGILPINASFPFPNQFSQRIPPLGINGNWWLAAWELYLRNPVAQRFAIFQDDIVAMRGLRGYLERSYPADGYCNLCTYPDNQAMADGHQGWYLTNQNGHGAQALVFDNPTLIKIITSAHFPNVIKDENKRHKTVDGRVMDAARKCTPPIREYVHNPSLVCHVGADSTLGNHPELNSTSFPGEAFDASTLPEPSIRSIA